jgi:nicotinate-nucleotide adenylyltransferase
MVGDRAGTGVLGGTFDPPHFGHLAVASAVRDALSLDEVLLVVANDPWQKVGRRDLSPAQDRLAMVRAAVEGLPGVQASAIEIERGGPSYMVETLGELKQQAPERPLFLILGADAAALLDTWVRHEELPDLATLVIVDRPGYGTSGEPAGWHVIHVTGPESPVSSSSVRETIASGGAVENFVPGQVLLQIRQRGLYGVGRT